MVPKPILVLLSATLALSGMAAARAADMYPWRQHEAPFSFVFGNEIDTHQ